MLSAIAGSCRVGVQWSTAMGPPLFVSIVGDVSFRAASQRLFTNPLCSIQIYSAHTHTHTQAYTHIGYIGLPKGSKGNYNN